MYILSDVLERYGELKINLYGDAIPLYISLRNKGLIAQLEKVDHHGYLIHHNSSSSINKWQYLLLQLHITTDIIEGSRIGRLFNSEFEKIETLAKLQKLIFYSNIGSIHGTFSTYNHLIERLSEKPQLKKSFLKSIKSEEACEFCQKIISSKDVFNFKYVIALKILFETEDLGDYAQDFIVNFVLNDKWILSEGRRDKLSILIEKCHKLVFLFVDSQNSYLPLSIDITKLVFNPTSYGRLLYPQSRDIDDLLNGIEKSFTKNLYLSKRACKIHSINQDNLRAKLEAKTITGPISSLIREVKNIYGETNFRTELDNRMCLQFYINKADIEDLYGKFLNFSTVIELCLRKKKFLSEKFKTKGINFEILPNNKRDLLTFNIIFDQKNELIVNRQFFQDYFQVHDKTKELIQRQLLAEIENQYEVKESQIEVRDLVSRDLFYHYDRKVVFNFLRLICSSKKLKVYTRYEYRIIEKYCNSLAYKKKHFYGVLPSDGDLGAKYHFSPELESIIQSLSEGKKLLRNAKFVQNHFLTGDKHKNYTKLYFSVLPIELERSESLNENSELVENCYIDSLVIGYSQDKIKVFFIEIREKYSEKGIREKATLIENYINSELKLEEIELINDREHDLYGGIIPLEI